MQGRRPPPRPPRHPRDHAHRRRGLPALRLDGDRARDPPPRYFGPYEHLWRSHGAEPEHWTPCTAGQTVIGLESDGTLKGCPSLATAGHAAGNVRELPLEEIWHHAERLHAGRARSVDDLWGFCATCYYAEACRGGCTWMADSLLGRPGNNPCCHYRVLELAKRGLRERIVKVREAPREAFATGGFDLVTEPMPGREGREPAAGVSTPRPPARIQTGDGLPPTLALCRACHCFVWPDETACPHCGADLAAAAARWDEDARRRMGLVAELERMMEEARAGFATG